MQYQLNAVGEQRLAEFVDLIGNVLRREARKESFAIYARGLLGDGERKSVEPIAARACPDPKRIDAMHQKLLHFVGVSDWSDVAVRRAAAEYALPLLTRHEPISAWVLDDTGMLKQGSHSVGVQRQYTGSAGKIANCQIAVALSVMTASDHLPIDFDLYLPRSWTGDRARRKEARVPRSIRFRTKIEIGLDLIGRAVDAGVPRGIVLADSYYGDSARFRRELRQLGLHYAVGVTTNLKVWRADKFEVRRGDKIALRDLAAQVPEDSIHAVTWRDGTKGPLSGRFAARRVVPCRADGVPAADREVVWLVIEWENGSTEPSKFYLCSLTKDATLEHLVRALKDRWRTERIFEDLKGELGFDHFEGRSYRGWQHHVSVVLCCYAFVAGERALAFSPSGGETRDGSDSIAA